MTGEKKKILPALLMCLLGAGQYAYAAGAKEGTSPLDELPEHITRITNFGQRADFSHDGKRILFVEKTFGDVYEVDIETKIIRAMTHHYFHEGYTRALYLSNGDILLSGARTFDVANPWISRSGDKAELWVLKKDLSAPPTALGQKCSEGPAVSRRRMYIVWTQAGEFYSGDIVYDEGRPKLAKKKRVLAKKKLRFQANLETQNLRPPAERELIFSAYGYQGTEVCGLNLKNGKIVNYSMAPDQYDEPEGIFPDGKHTLVECDKHSGEGTQHIDLYKLALDGSGRTERITFFSDYPGYKASNPVVSDDGRYIAFQAARRGDPAGVGRGILIFDIEKSTQQAVAEITEHETDEKKDIVEPEDEVKADRVRVKVEDRIDVADPNEAAEPGEEVKTDRVQVKVEDKTDVSDPNKAVEPGDEVKADRVQVKVQDKTDVADPNEAAEPGDEVKADRVPVKVEDKIDIPEPNERAESGDDKTGSKSPDEEKAEIISIFEIDEAREESIRKGMQVEAEIPREPNTLEGRIARIERIYGVKVCHEYDAEAFFPPEWLRPPISGEGSQMPRREVTRAVGAIEEFLKAYPRDVLAKNLKTIFLIRGMKFYGKGYGAAYGRSAIYVNNEGERKGYSYEFLLSQMHSELSSIFLINYGADFPADKWKDINPSGSRYGGTGVEMLGQRDIFAQTDELLSRGFLVKYSQSSLENDVNMFAFWAFTKPDKLKELTSRYVRIAAKHKIIVEFYKKIHPEIDINGKPETSTIAN